jgi:hypothetical protein
MVNKCGGNWFRPFHILVKAPGYRHPKVARLPTVVIGLQPQTGDQLSMKTSFQTAIFQIAYKDQIFILQVRLHSSSSDNC